MADMTITITIPDATCADFVDAYCERYGWVDLATSGPRPAFAREQASKLVRAPLRMWRQDKAYAAALAATVADDGITAK